MRSIVKTCESESPAKMWAQSKPIKEVHDPKHDMQIVPKIPEFELPDGWVVEVRPRGPNSSITMSDKVLILFSKFNLFIFIAAALLIVMFLDC